MHCLLTVFIVAAFGILYTAQTGYYFSLQGNMNQYLDSNVEYEVGIIFIGIY